MEKNGNGTSTTSDSSWGCGKLFSAIASPAFQTIRQISFPARDRSPLANLNHAAGTKIIDIQIKPQQPNKSVDQVIRVPIKFEKTAAVQPATPNENYKGKFEPEPAPLAQKRVIAIEHITHGQDGKKSKSKSPSPVKGAAVGEAQQVLQAQNPGVVDMNDKFSEYINRVKIKIRTMSSKKIQEPDHDGNDGGKDVHFSDYIHSAKNKFKSSTSNVGK